MGPDPVTQLRPQWRHWILLGTLLTAEGSFLLGVPSPGPGWVEQLWRDLQMPVLGPHLFLQGQQGPWNSSLSRGGVVQLIPAGQVGVCLLPPVTPTWECAQRGRAEGP